MCVCVRVCRVLTALGDWLSAGGLYIIAGCLASVATLIVVLSVAVCLVRTRLSRRRRKMLPVSTKIELQETARSDEPARLPAHDPLITREMSDIALNEFDSQPVRYVVGLHLFVAPASSPPPPSSSSSSVILLNLAIRTENKIEIRRATQPGLHDTGC